MATEPSDSLVVIAANDVNLPSTGQPNKTVPSNTLLTNGYDKDETVFAEHLNYTFNNIAQWVNYSVDFIKEVESKVEQNTSDIENNEQAISDNKSSIEDINQELSDTSYTAGDGLSVTGGSVGEETTFAVDNTVIRTTGDQSLNGQKTFSTAPKVPSSTPSDDQCPSWAEVKRLTTWNRISPLNIYNGAGVGSLTDIPVSSSIPDGAEVKVNFQCYFDAPPTSIGTNAKYLLVDGDSSSVASNINANMLFQYADSNSETFASAGQILVTKESGRLRLSGYNNRAGVDIILTITHYREQS